MASSTRTTTLTEAQSVMSDGNLDTLLLMSRLSLEDIREVNAMRKRKNREGAPLSDDEYAFQMQLQELQTHTRLIEDSKLAKSIQDALRTDQAFISAIMIAEQAAADDRRAALATSRGEALPERTVAQRRMEERTFSPFTTRATPQVDVLRSNTQNGMSTTQAQDTMRATTQNPTPLVVRRSPLEMPPRLQRVECVICSDQVRMVSCLHAPCDHYYCPVCVVSLVDACTRDESLYPLRCCRQTLAPAAIEPFLSAQKLSLFRSKCLEFATPPLDRIYCPTSTCSAFLGSSKVSGRYVRCKDCSAIACTLCKQNYHPGESCGENKGFQEVLELARTEHWQTCPRCHAIIELHQGCYHMTCRCSAQFCYLCAVPWKNCTCPQWDEARLLDTAQRQVANEVGVGARVQARLAQPAYIEQVQRRVRELRTNHDCERHSWRRRNGGGNCEECGNYLRDFLLVCRGCHVMACVRCSRNRL